MRPPLARPVAPGVREHDARLGGLIRANPLAILVVDATNRAEMCNAAFESLFGYREAEIAGTAIESLIVPPERTNEAAELSRCARDGQSSQSVTQRRRKDGTLVDVELTIVPLSDDGLATGAYTIYRDLTEQRRTEHHLRAQYAVVEALAQSSTIEDAAPRVLRAVADAVGWQVGAMWIVDKTASQLKCIELWRAKGVDAQLFEAETRAGRFPRGVGPGRTWDTGTPRWIVDVTKEEQFSRRAAAQAAGLHAAFSFPMMLEGNVVGVVEFFTSTVLESDDTILRMFAALGQQLGEFVGRTRTQEQIERFFTMSQDLLCIAGFDGYFKRVNEAWSRVLGYTAPELLAEPYSNLVHLEDRDAAQVELARLATGEAATWENRWRCRDGSYKWLFWNAIAKPEEQVIYAVARDDTARQVADHQLKETLKMRHDFVSFVTHQLRTPLSGIKWMLELASDAESMEEARSYIQDGRESADRLIGLVNDLLDVSRLESGKLEVNLERVQVAELTRDVLGDVAALVREKGHKLVVDAPPTLPGAMLDRQLLRQAILNLISNAIKYTPPGGRIDIRIGHDDGLHWSIRDNGIGIPKTGQARLFEKFYRAENAPAVDTEGTGLGLYLVRLIVERFGGTIACESDEGLGTLVHFVLPIAAVDQ
jgi:two-component system, sensor histidine kinase and response regulator